MLTIKDAYSIKMPQNQDFIPNLIKLRSHYKSLQDKYERSYIHIKEQLERVNALLVDQLVEQQEQHIIETLMNLRSYYQSLQQEPQQKAQSAEKQIANINALLADFLVLQHNAEQHISIQSATLEQQALIGAMPAAVRGATIADNTEESQKQSPELAQESKPPEISQQVASDISQGEHDEASVTPNKESPQQDLEVVESPEPLQVSEPQIPTDSSRGQRDEEKPSLPEPKPIGASEPQIPTDANQVKQQPELEPPTELPSIEDSSERSLLGKPATFSSSRHAAPLKTPLLPQYKHLTKSEAVEQLLQENEGKVLHINYIIRALYGELKPEDIAAEKPRMSDSLKKGIAKGLWDRVPDSPGYYTADMKLVDKEVEQKKVEEKKPQGRKPNSKATEGMLPRYQNLTFTQAVETVLRDLSGKIVTSDIMARALYGEVEGPALVEAKNKVGKIMWSGANQGRWQSVPGQKGAYTLDLKLID